MPYFLTYARIGDILVVKATGDYADVQEFIAKKDEATLRIMEERARRILLDDRELTMTLDVHDAVTFADAVLEEGVPAQGLRFACLPPKTGREFYAAFETACRNRSINYQLFEDKQAAVDWLES